MNRSYGCKVTELRTGAYGLKNLGTWRNFRPPRVYCSSDPDPDQRTSLEDHRSEESPEWTPVAGAGHDGAARKRQGGVEAEVVSGGAKRWRGGGGARRGGAGGSGGRLVAAAGAGSAVAAAVEASREAAARPRRRGGGVGLLCPCAGTGGPATGRVGLAVEAAKWGGGASQWWSTTWRRTGAADVSVSGAIVRRARRRMELGFRGRRRSGFRGFFK